MSPPRNPETPKPKGMCVCVQMNQICVRRWVLYPTQRGSFCLVSGLDHLGAKRISMVITRLRPSWDVYSFFWFLKRPAICKRLIWVRLLWPTVCKRLMWVDAVWPKLWGRYTWFDQHYISDCGAYMKEEQERKEKAKGEAGEGSAVRSWRKNRRGRTKQKRKRYRNHQPRNPGLLSQICYRQKHPMKHRTAQGWFHQCSIYLRSLPKRQQPGVVGFFYWDPPHIFVGLHRSSIYHLHTTYI